MNILYLVTGADEMISLQVKFSIKTILAQKNSGDSIFVVTDTPIVYSRIDGINVIPVDEAQIKEWKGPHNFFWRSKIMALRMIAEQYPQDHLMYLDGDTFLGGKLDDIRKKLDEGYSMMHVDEGCPSEMKGKSRRMWEQSNGHTYAGIKITSKHHMWNAGVVAIPSSCLKEVLDTALGICDGMLDDDVEPITVEQYSLSIGQFENTKELLPAKEYIGHYWHNKYEWCVWIAQFFALSYVKKRTQEEEINAISKISLFGINKKLNVKRTLKKLIGKKK